MGKFLILRGGKHQQFVPDPEVGKPKMVIYKKGDIVDSEKDLCKMFNSRGVRKFRKMPDNTPAIRASSTPETELPEADVTTVEDAFAGLTISALRAIAEEEEIDLGDATLKRDILQILRDSIGE